MGSPRLRSLQIHKYRHVVPGTRLEFGESFNVLLGRNGTGKTTLLELIEMIWAKGFGQIADEPFHLEYSVEFDDVSIPADPTFAAFGPSLMADRRVPGCLILVDVENVAVEVIRPESRHPRIPNPPLQFRYQIKIATLSNAPLLTVEGTQLGATLRIGEKTVPIPVLAASALPVVWTAPTQYFGRPRAEAVSNEEAETDSRISDWASWCGYILQDIHNTGRHDESLGAFQALTSREYRLFGSGIEGARWEIERSIDEHAKVYPLDTDACAFFPFEITLRWYNELAKDPKREHTEFQTSIRDTRLAVFIELTGYSDVIIRSGPPDRSRNHDSHVEHLRFGPPEIRVLLQEDRGEIPAQALSYGEKRLLSFLWHLACNPSVIIADELVNGFHHAWIERCVELIGTRQAFLASQNPLLLDCLPLASEEHVRGCFITCRRNADGQMSWTNLSAEEAADFYRSYERQTRYTHEILRSKGLW